MRLDLRLAGLGTITYVFPSDLAREDAHESAAHGQMLRIPPTSQAFMPRGGACLASC